MYAHRNTYHACANQHTIERTPTDQVVGPPPSQRGQCQTHRVTATKVSVIISFLQSIWHNLRSSEEVTMERLPRPDWPEATSARDFLD